MTPCQIESHPLVETLQLTKLQRALLITKTPIFDEDQVEAYKSKVRTRENWLAFLKAVWRGIVTLLSLTVVMVCLSWFGWRFLEGPIALRCLPAVACGVAWLISASGFYFWILPSVGFLRNRLYRSWFRCALECYDPAETGAPPVPAEVMANADAIRELAPDAQFDVEYLGNDPVLSVYDPEDGRRYDIAIWD